MDDDNDLASSGEGIGFINAKKEKNGYVKEYVEIEELLIIQKPYSSTPMVSLRNLTNFSFTKYF